MTTTQQRLVDLAIAAGYLDPDHDPDPEFVRVPVEWLEPKGHQ